MVKQLMFQYGKCEECGSFLENWGASSDGDGDLYDVLGCPLCEEVRGKANELWIDDAGHVFMSEDDLYEFGDFDPVKDRRSLAARLRAVIFQIKQWWRFDVLKQDSIPF